MSKKREILQRLHIKKGEYLIRQGDFGINGYVVQSGMLEVFITQDGQEIRLAVLGPGEVVGANWHCCMTAAAAPPYGH